MADVETKVEEQVKVEETTVKGTENQEEQKETHDKKKFESKWDLIDKIKSSDKQTVVLNIFKVHTDATWREIKETYKEFQMRIDKVPNKDGMFNLHFKNHNDAINFIKVSPKPILDKKFLIRINDRINKETSDGWNEMGLDGHTQKHENMKYYKSKAKKVFNKKPTEEGENAETATEEKTTEGLNLPTRSIVPKTEKAAEETAEGEQPAPARGQRKISSDDKAPKTTGERKRFIGESSKPQFTNNYKKEAPKTEEKPVVEKKTEDSWNTVADHAQEKKAAFEAKKKADKVLKEKEAKEKKEHEATKKTDAPKKDTVPKKGASNFADGWD